MYTLVSNKLGIKMPTDDKLPKPGTQKFDGEKFLKAAEKAKEVFEKEERQLEEDEKRRIFASNL